MQDVSPIIVTGSIAIDRLMRFEGHYKELIQPDKLDSLTVSPLISDVSDALGGVAGNISYTLALLGDRPILLGSVGIDGEMYMQKLAKDGVDVSHVHQSELLTANCTTITDSDQSQIGGFYPGAMSDSATQSFEPWKRNSPLALVGPHDPVAMKRQVKECADWALNLVYDPGQQITTLPVEDMAEGLQAAHILIVNAYELSLLAKRIGQTEDDIRKRVPILITTLGKDGSRVEGNVVEQPFEVAVATPTQIVDGTGAGDAYRAGFLHGYARGWALRDCARLGSVTGSFAVEQTGTQNHRPSRAMLAARYQQTFDEPIPSE